jgi:hypothetical protein
MSPRTTTTAVAVLAAAAVAAPTAAARPADSVQPAAPAVHRTIEVSTSGFDWADAGLGAAAMLTLVGVGGGAVVLARRRQPTLS